MPRFRMTQFEVIFCRSNGEEVGSGLCFDAENREAAARRAATLSPPYRAAVAKVLDNGVVFKKLFTVA